MSPFLLHRKGSKFREGRRGGYRMAARPPQLVIDEQHIAAIRPARKIRDPFCIIAFIIHEKKPFFVWKLCDIGLYSSYFFQIKNSVWFQASLLQSATWGQGPSLRRMRVRRSRTMKSGPKQEKEKKRKSSVFSFFQMIYLINLFVFFFQIIVLLSN